MAGVQMSLHLNVVFENGNLVLRLTMRTAAAVLIHHGGSALTGVLHLLAKNAVNW
jgi:hypothetical protein